MKGRKHGGRAWDTYVFRLLLTAGWLAVWSAGVWPTGARAQSDADKPAEAVAGDKVADDERGQIEAGTLSKLPRQSKFVQAEYPAAAVAENIEADVMLLLDIDETGKVTAVSIAEPATQPDMGFEEAALVAAHQFEFEPAEMDGQPVAVQISYRYRFVLQPAAIEQPAQPPAAEGPEESTAPEGAVAPTAGATRPDLVVNFSGVLRERGTRLVMSGVLVTVFRDDGAQAVGYEATSDEQGRFQFFDLDPGPWKILIEPPGYYPFRTSEDIVVGEATEVKYYVERGSYNPYDVTVTASRPRKEVSRTVIPVKEIDKIPGTIGDPLAVVQNLAGVARVPAFSGQIIVRGSAPQDSRVFVDGVEVPNIYHFGGLRSVLPVGMLDAIQFYPGNFGPEYGRATGGVIDVKTKNLAPKKISGYADVSLLDTGVYLEVPITDTFSVAVAGRRSYVDFILQATIPDDAGVNIIAAPRYYDYQILANYRPAPAHDIRAFYFGSDDRLEFLFQNPGEADLNLSSGRLNMGIDFQRALLSYRYTPSSDFSNHLRLSSGRDGFGFGFGQLGIEMDLYSSQIRDHVEHKLSDWLTLGYGVDFLFTRASGYVNLPLPPQEGQPPPDNFDIGDTLTSEFTNQDLWAPAGFVEAEIKVLGGDLRLFPGLRVDHFSRRSQTLASPRITARHQVNKEFLVKGGVGLFQQEPYTMEGQTDPVFGNPNLKVSRAMHYSAGVEYRPREHLSLDATVFYKDMWDLVSATDATTTDADGTIRPLIYDNGGEGRVYGLELVLRHEFTNKFSGWLAYTLSRAERTDSGATESRLFDFDQPHILTAIASYLLPRNWQIGGRFRLVSGNPITPYTGAVFNASADRYNPIFGAVNSGRLGVFHQLDIRIDKRWIYDGWTLNAYLDLQNVYNRANPEGLTANFNYRQVRPQQGLPIFPILGLRGEF